MTELSPDKRLCVDRRDPAGVAAASLLGYLGVSASLVEEPGTRPPVLEGKRGRVSGIDAIAGRVIDDEATSRLAGSEQMAWVLEPFLFDWFGRARRNERVVPRIGGLLRGMFDANERRRPWFEEASSGEDVRAVLATSARRTRQTLEELYEACDGYLGGRRPSLTDFFVYGACRSGRSGSAPGRNERGTSATARRLDWLERMELPHPVTALRTGRGREPADFRPLVAEFAGTYWRVLEANGRGVASDRQRVEVKLVDGRTLAFEPTETGVERLASLLRRLEAIADRSPEILTEEGLDVLGPLGGMLEVVEDCEPLRARVGELRTLVDLVRLDGPD